MKKFWQNILTAVSGGFLFTFAISCSLLVFWTISMTHGLIATAVFVVIWISFSAIIYGAEKKVEKTGIDFLVCGAGS